MGVRGQPQASRTAQPKPRIEVRGHPDFVKFRAKLKASQNSQEKYLDKLIDAAIDLLGQRPTAGEQVQRKLWPKVYRALGIPCLFRYKLNDNYRMTYSLIKIKSNPLFAWIIEVMDHTEYNRRFGYD